MTISEEGARDFGESPAEKNTDLGKLRSRKALREIYLPRPAVRDVALGDVQALYDDARVTLGDCPLTYLEFGVYSGTSISRIAQRFQHPNAEFYGFDSFEGLPEDWILPWKTIARGTFSMEGRLPAVRDPRIQMVKGWFQNTLPAFLEQKKGVIAPTVLVHFDADLYSSTLFILCTLWHYIEEYYFIFDEFPHHEVVALHDFSQAYPIELTFLCQTNPGKIPGQLFGRIRKVPFIG